MFPGGMGIPSLSPLAAAGFPILKRSELDVVFQTMKPTALSGTVNAAVETESGSEGVAGMGDCILSDTSIKV